MPPYRILSLDGGGCRVIIESVLINRLLEDYPNLLNEVDLFAGTSAGAILALGLASGFTCSEASKFCQEEVKKVFTKSWLREFETLGSTLGSEYSNENLKEMLSAQFGDLKMGELKKKVFIPAFQLDNNLSGETPRRWVPRFFHNLGENSSSNGESVVDVALRTSAAPTYFPIYQGYVDGGIFANNPALCAVTTAIAAGVSIKDIVVLSLSSGRDGLFISSKKYDDGDWGLTQWAPHLTDMLLDSCMEVTDFQCTHLLGPHYHRIDPPLPKEVPLDNPNENNLLSDLARKVDLAPTYAWINQHWLDGPDIHPETSNTPTTFPGIPPTILSSKTYGQALAGLCSIQ